MRRTVQSASHLECTALNSSIDSIFLSVLRRRLKSITEEQWARTYFHPEQKKALQAEADRKAAENQVAAEQKRRDKALLDTFTTVKEIDLKRNRDIQLIESNIEAQLTNLKNANDRQADARNRIEQYKKENKPAPVPIQEELERSEAAKIKIQAQIAQKRKEIVDLNQQYDDMKKRFAELTGTAPPATPAPAPGPAAATTKPAASPAPAATTSAAAAKK